MSKNTGTSELINYFDLGANGDVGIAGSLDINTIANATTDTDTFLVSDTGIIKYRTGAQLLSDIGGQAAGNYVTTDTSQAITANKSFTVGFSLGSEGSGNQTSFFRNTSSLFSGSGGTNIFGFNNSNNIYFGKGLNNGGVLQWNNTTATRYYTLPDADGTIALTSSLSGYLPLTGGTLTGALNGTSATFSGAELTLTAASTQPFLRVSRTGTGVRSYYWGINGGSTFFLQDETANVTRITLTSGGVMTLTADVNVTGALNGTNAVFGSTVQSVGILSAGNAGATTGQMIIESGANAASRRWKLLTSQNVNGDFVIQQSTTQTGSTFADILGFNATGAANFSNSLRIQGATPPTSGSGTELAWDGTNGYLLAFNRTSSAYLPLFVQGSTLNFGTGDGTTKMLITSSGNVLIGTATDGGYKLNVAGTIRSLSATPLVVSMTSNPGNHAIIAARWTSGVGMDMSYFPDFAQGFIDNTYQVTAGQPYGDIYFRQNVSGTMTSRMTIKADGGRVGIGTTNPAGRLSVNDAVYGEYLRVATGVIGGNQTSVYLAWNNAGNITLQQVTVGAADSGGSGFRLLRIPNT
jgi:hypothetical protein